jgi:hypothetical protein
MTNETHSVQVPLSTDLEALRTRMKDQFAYAWGVETSAQRPRLGHAVDPVSVTVLLCCDSRSVHTFRYRYRFHRRMYSDRTRAPATPLYHAPASVDRSVNSIAGGRHQSGPEARELCSAAVGLSTRWTNYAAADWLKHRHRRPRFDVAIAYSFFEFHSCLGGRSVSSRHDGEGRLVCVAWPLNGSR